MAWDKIPMKTDSRACREMSMPQWNFERTVISMGILTEFGIDHGVPAQALLAGTGVSKADLAESDLHRQRPAGTAPHAEPG